MFSSNPLRLSMGKENEGKKIYKLTTLYLIYVVITPNYLND